jgi:hypothetical protein
MTALTAAQLAAPPIVVPADFRARLDAARSEGVADAQTFASEHTPAERWMVPDWALMREAYAPSSDAEDLAYLRKLVKTRTPAGVARAQYWAKHGLDGEWERLLEQYTLRASPEQALAAKKLLHDALSMTNAITQTAKGANLRKRPFVVDPKLPLAVEKPGNNPSYPSGHTSAAFAAALVLAHLMPDRAEEFLGLAQEASFSRVYAGVHFPTDVIAGAKLATTVVTYLNATSGTTPLNGTAGRNTGVVGPHVVTGTAAMTAIAGAAPLPGAVVLEGPPLLPQG